MPEADFAIRTIPAPILKAIPHDLEPATRATIADIEFDGAIKIGFQARCPFREEDDTIFGGIPWTDVDVTQIWYPSNDYQREGIS